MMHYTEKYLLNPSHKVTVNVVGLGGTGSQVLTLLTRMNEALIALQHPGLHVRCYDDDKVSSANIGRQLFYPSDINRFKAEVLVSRINRSLGYNWEAHTIRYDGAIPSNILISCVDSVASRKEIAKILKQRTPDKFVEPLHQPYYWMDFGNSLKTGQVVLGTLCKIPQPNADTRSTLKNVFEYFPQLKKKTFRESNEPSCSLAEALNKQDLYINSTLAQLGIDILWKMFREGRTKFQGCFLNLDTMNVNPIKIQ